MEGLKIKDNVDLKELEKFGFKEIDYEFKKWYMKVKTNRELARVVIFKDTKEIYMELDEPCYRASNEIEILYDLIQAGLVEKVEERK